MLINNLYNVQPKPIINTKSAYFSAAKHGSEITYQAQEETKQSNNIVNFQNKLNDKQQQTTASSFNGYYDMFVASQALQNSEILNSFNHQMYMKKYA